MTISLRTGKPPRIIVVGQTFEESRTVQRVNAMRSLACPVSCVPTVPAGLNYESPPSLVQRIRYRLRRPADPARANKAIIHEVQRGADILWLDAADMIHASTLHRAKKINQDLVIVWYCEDDMLNPRLRTKQLDGSLSLFDLWVTTKSFNAAPEELPSLGVKNVMFVNNSCDPALHRPIEVSEEDKKNFGSPVSFIGSFEEPRAQSVMHLAQSGISVRVWGNGWSQWVGRHPNLNIENRPAYNEEFAKVISASAINLCFLRHANRDLQTCRSIEIPACAGFMVHERNSEITSLFREEKEAVYFSSDEELARVCSFWIGNDQTRRHIGETARKRTLDLELIHESNIIRIINTLPSQRSDVTP